MKNTRRANNTGSICIEKATNKYRAALTIDGKRVVKRFGTEEEAKRWLTITQADVYQGRFVDPSKLTFKEFAEQYLELFCADLRPTTSYLYYHYLSKLQPLFNIKIQNLTIMDIQRCITNLTLAPSTKRQARNLAKRVLDKAVEMDIVPKNVAIGVKVKTKKKTISINNQEEHKIFTDKELNKILKAAKSVSRVQDYALFIRTAILTGMRLGEIIGLQYKDIKEDSIEVNSCIVQLMGKNLETLPKTDAGVRLISVPSELCEKLRNHNSEGMTSNDYVFHTRSRRPLFNSNIETMWVKILKLAGVPHRSFHKLRHNHASVLIANGTSLIDVSKRLGHSNPIITVQTYSHITPGYKDRIDEKITQAFSGIKE